MKLVNRRDILRGFVTVGVGTIGAGMLASCAATAPAPVATEAAPAAAATTPEVPTQATSATRSVEFWSSWRVGGRFPEIVTAFEAKYPDIKVEYVKVPGEELEAKVFAAIAAGTPPGMSFNIPYFEFATRGLLVPLDDYVNVNEDANLTSGDIPEVLLEKFRWRDKLYGLPAADTSIRYGMGFNIDFIESQGLDPATLPQSWDEVYSWHEAMTEMDDQGNIKTLGIDPTNDATASGSSIDPWVYPEMWGFHYFDEEKNAFDIDRAETVELLATIKKFWDLAGPEKITGLSQALSGQDFGAFGIGRQGMYLGWSSDPANLFQVYPDTTFRYTWLPVSSARKGTKITTIGGHAATIFKGAADPDAVFLWDVFLTEKEACDVFKSANGWIGPRKSYQDTVDLSEFPDYVQEDIWWFTRDSIAQADENWVEKDPIGNMTEQEWNNMRQAVIFGDLSPEEAAKQMQEKMTQELADWETQVS